MFETNRGNLKFDRVLMVPAGRELDGSIDTIIGELNGVTAKGILRSDDCALVILETGTPDITRHNMRLLRSKLKHAPLAVTTLHLMPETLEQYIATLCGFDRKLVDLFLQKNNRLNRTANLLSLVAVTLGARYLHQRDPAVPSADSNGNGCTLLERELAAFAGLPGNAAIIGTNSTYTPDPRSFLSENQHAPHLKSTDIADVAPECRGYPKGPREPPVVHGTSTPLSLWKCSATRNIFRHFANPPHMDTPGTDCFFKLLATAAGIPVQTLNTPTIGFHETRSPHSAVCRTTRQSTGSRRHASNDTEYDIGSSYAVMFARYVDFAAVYSMVADFKPLLSLSPTGYTTDILSSMADKAATRTGERKLRLTGFADSIAIIGNDLSSTIATAVAEAIPSIITGNHRHIQSHAYLQKQWKKLTMRAACQMLPAEAI